MKKLTPTGIIAFLVGLTFIASKAKASRFEIGPFQAHPSLILAFMTLPFVAGRFRLFPAKIFRAFVIFSACLWVVTLADPIDTYGPAVKLPTTLFFIVTTFAIVQSFDDYRAAVLGMGIGVAMIGVIAVGGGDVGTETFNPMVTIGNKNAFSLFGLPAVLLCSELAFRKGTGLPLRTMLLGCVGLIVLVIFLGANRSGWLSCVFIALMIIQARGNRLRGFITVLLIAGGTLFVLREFFDTAMIERRFDQTFNNYSSDALRQMLFKECFWIGVEHPILGIGPGGISPELAVRCSSLIETDLLGPHNAVTYIFGLGGLVLVAGWLLTGRELWRFGKPLEGAAPLVRMTLALWLVRGLFTDEVLFSPGFAFAFGLAISDQALRLAQVTVRKPALAEPAASPLAKPVSAVG